MSFSNINISKVIPHAPSFRFVDKIISENSVDSSITAIVSFGQHLGVFSGHYPDEQIVPGVIVIEALSQCSILCGHRFLSTASSIKYVHLTLEVQCKFKKTIHYTDDIILYSKIEQNIGNISVFRVKAIDVKNNIVCASGKITGIALTQPQKNSKDEKAENH